jgi:oxazoline/thiazoline dehydrogenase
MFTSFFLSLQEGVSFTPRGTGELILHSPQTTAILHQLTPGTLAALTQLRPPGEREDRLTELVRQTDGAAGLAQLDSCLQQLTQQGVLVRSVWLHDQPLATLVPMSPAFVFASRGIVPERFYRLSRFAYTRAERGQMLLESPLAHARITLADWRAAALVHVLAQPHRIEDISRQVSALSAEAADGLMTLLINADMLWELSNHEVSPEDDNLALQSWEFHDLLFHARSRAGRHDYPRGGTYRFAGRLDPPPVLQSVRSEESVVLDRPDLDRLEREDPPFAWVQEARRSIREYADKPISARQLGEFLYRVGRVADYFAGEVPTPEGAVQMDFAPRPYPAGGALYELELYTAVNLCENLASGLYYYEPQYHRLERLAGRTADVEQLLRDAGQATMIPSECLQVLILIGARFQRLTWKYASIAYALLLKHVGVLYQTMYLVATAMQLAPCAVGVGDADLFTRAAGTDYYTETSVGEFLLGSKR